MMQKILSILTRPPIPMCSGTVLAILLFWFGGALLREAYGWPSQGFTVLLCILVAAAAVGFTVLRTVRARRKAKAIENEIRAQARVHAETLRPDRQGDFAELQQRFDEALESLKASKLGRGALYALPWYVIIGPPGSGKTTAITESGLNFPFLKGPQQKRGIRGLGGTRNCDWWFTDQAILLDTAGRYTTEAEDHEEWLTFLGMIKKARKLKPINGVMVAISIVDVLSADENQLEQHAETIRKRIDELVKQLEVVFPVYLVFTKCDLLDGFVEFFSALSKEARGQVWGATFDRGGGPGQEMQDRFAGEIDQLCGQISRERMRLLVPDRPTQQQQKIFSLPLQLHASKKRLTDFVRLLTQPNPYSEASELRGFYLTSGTQEGAPIDQVLQSLSSAFGLLPRNEPAESAPVEAKSYFIRDLFTKVMFADRDLARSSARVQRQRELMRLGVIYGSAAALLILGLNSIFSYSNTLTLIDGVKQASLAVRAQPIDPDRQGEPAADAARQLNLLRDRYGELLAAYSPTSLLGPSWEVTVHAMADYAEGIKRVFLSPCKEHVEARLREYVASPTGADEFAAHSQILLVYRAMDKDFVQTVQLREAIQRQNLWKWAPADLGKAATTMGTSEESRHLETYLAARKLSPNTWVLGNVKTLLGDAEQKLKSGGGLAQVLRGYVEQSETLLQASEDDLKRNALTRIEEESALAGQVPRELVEETITTVRKTVVMERVAKIGLLHRNTLDEVIDSLADLDRENSPHMVTFRDALSTLRKAQALPSPGLSRDTVADTFAAALKEIAGLRVPINDLVSGRRPGERILPDLLAGRQEQLGAVGQQFREARRKVEQQLKEMQQSSGEAAEPIRAAIDGMFDTVAEGIARELRAEIQEMWDRKVGNDLRTMMQSHPFTADGADDAAPAQFNAMFRPEGSIATFQADLAKARAVQELGRKLELGDRYTAFMERVANIRTACFDPEAPRDGTIRFRVGRMTRDPNVQDLILTIAQGDEVKATDGTEARRFNTPRKWRIGDRGSNLRMELTIVEGGRNRSLTIPDQTDPRGQQSPWGLFRVLATAESSVTPEDVKFTWTRDYVRGDESEKRTVSSSITLKAEGGVNVFHPGFFALEPPAKVFKADSRP